MNPKFNSLKMKKRHWDRLLDEIKDHKITPVIGPELLRVEIDGKKWELYDYVARKLIEELELEDFEFDEQITVSEVAFAFKQVEGDLLDVYYMVGQILRNIDCSIPDSLLKLAEMSHFDLFITTTPDHLLRKALDEVRFEGKEQTRNIAYSPSIELSDVEDDYEPKPMFRPVVLQLLGNANLAPNFMVTEDDLLDYVNRLQGHDHRPENLLDVLGPRSLAWIGVSFPDWLIRFLLCSTKRDALFGSYGVRGYVADRHTRHDEKLLSFLSRNNSLVYTNGESCEFISELHEKWKERFGNDDVGDPPSLATSPAPKRSAAEFPKNGVFISYAHEDKEAAQQIKKLFEEHNIHAWIDNEQLESGDRWEEVIRRNIERCSIFVPIISHNTATIERRYFRMEWNCAIREQEVRASGYPFIQPLLVDSISPDDETVPREFRERHWTQCNNGVPGQEFFEKAKQTIRNLSRQQRKSN